MVTNFSLFINFKMAHYNLYCLLQENLTSFHCVYTEDMERLLSKCYIKGNAALIQHISNCATKKPRETNYSICKFQQNRFFKNNPLKIWAASKHPKRTPCPSFNQLMAIPSTINTQPLLKRTVFSTNLLQKILSSNCFQHILFRCFLNFSAQKKFVQHEVGFLKVKDDI